MPANVTSTTAADVVYPESDGQPMGETGFHVRVMILLWLALRELFHGRADVYVAADMFLYYEEGNPRACKSPDVMVIKGVGNHERRIFKVWVEGAVPCVIFEVTSESTRQADEVDKPAVYAQLGVAEYFIFDPLEEYLEPAFQGFRLQDGRYVPMTPAAEGGLVSQELEARLVPEDGMIRVIPLGTDQPILTTQEKNERFRQELAAREREAAEKDRERQRADALAAEVERLRALLGQHGQVD